MDGARWGRLLSQAYRDCDADDDVRVSVLTGARDTFCSGADFSGGAAPFDSPDENSSSPPRQVAALEIALHRRVMGTDDARAVDRVGPVALSAVDTQRSDSSHSRGAVSGSVASGVDSASWQSAR